MFCVCTTEGIAAPHIVDPFREPSSKESAHAELKEYAHGKSVARCTNCATASRDDSMINHSCNRKVDGKTCRGVYRSAIGLDDWRECEVCGTRGRSIEGGRCQSCDGEGWIYQRSHA